MNEVDRLATICDALHQATNASFAFDLALTHVLQLYLCPSAFIAQVFFEATGSQARSCSIDEFARQPAT